MKKNKFFSNLLLAFGLIVLMFFVLFPLVWLILCSFKSDN